MEAVTLGDEQVRATRASWGRWLALALLVGVGALLAAQSWVTRLPDEGSAEVTFARDMAFHHAQAVEMAMLLRDRTANEELRYLTLDMALTQQAQIGQMQGWLAVWGQRLSGREPPMAGHGEAMGMANREQLASLQTLPVGEAEVAFLQLMIRHHQGGVVMAEEVLRQSRRPEVTRLATAIVAAQQSEIEAMAAMLAARGAALPEPLGDAPMEGHTH